jgi:hypothetical protein
LGRELPENLIEISGWRESGNTRKKALKWSETSGRGVRAERIPDGTG